MLRQQCCRHARSSRTSSSRTSRSSTTSVCRRQLSGGGAQVDAALAAARELGVDDRAALLDGLVGDLRAELLRDSQQRPAPDQVELAVRLADHGDLLRSLLNATVAPNVATGTDKRRTLFASKTAVTLLPKRAFTGKVVLARTADEICAALEPLKGCDIVGFDTETRPEFRPGQSQNPTCLMQIANADYCAVLQIRAGGRWTCRNLERNRWLPDPLVEFLEDSSVRKAGVGVAEDLKALGTEHSDIGLKPAGAVDLEQLVTKLPQVAKTINLQALVAIYLHFQMEKIKRVQCSNWESESLTERQLKYAATDAWVGYLVHEKISSLLPKSVRLKQQQPAAQPKVAAAPKEKKETKEKKEKLPAAKWSEIDGTRHYKCSNGGCETVAPPAALGTDAAVLSATSDAGTEGEAGSGRLSAITGGGAAAAAAAAGGAGEGSDDVWLPEHMFSTAQKGKPDATIRCIQCVQRSQQQQEA